MLLLLLLLLVLQGVRECIMGQLSSSSMSPEALLVFVGLSDINAPLMSLLGILFHVSEPFAVIVTEFIHATECASDAVGGGRRPRGAATQSTGADSSPQSARSSGRLVHDADTLESALGGDGLREQRPCRTLRCKIGDLKEPR